MEKTDRVRDVCVRYIYMPVAACGTSDSPAIPYALSPRSVPRTLHPPGVRLYSSSRAAKGEVLTTLYYFGVKSTKVLQ